MPPIAARDISIVFQGPAGHKGSSLSGNLKLARRVFPEAELILSTWKGASDPAFDLCDKVILNDDPGALYHEPVTRRANNILRQAHSTFRGLEAASRPYAAKVRTDFSITSDAILRLLPSFHPADPRHLKFRQPVLTLTSGSSDPTKFPKLFHPSDFFHFGLRDDLVDYWDYSPPPAYANNRFIGSMEKLFYPITGPEWGRVDPEQEIFLSFLYRKHGLDIFLRHLGDMSPALLQLSESIVTNSFCFADPEEAGVLMPERLLKHPVASVGMYPSSTKLAMGAVVMVDARARYKAASRAARRYWIDLSCVYSVASVFLKVTRLADSGVVHRLFRAFKRWRYRTAFGLDLGNA